MIYINENSSAISIPRHSLNTEGGYTLVVKSNVSNNVILVEDGGNISTNDFFYQFPLNNLSNLNVGEYTYLLYDVNSEVIETGLLMYGKYERTVVVNNTFNKEKIQYNG